LRAVRIKLALQQGAQRRAPPFARPELGSIAHGVRIFDALGCAFDYRHDLILSVKVVC
jgi:hypothetical protein